MNVFIGVLVSFAFVFAVIGLSTVLAKFGRLGPEGSRKFIHIGVSNWWFIAVVFFDSWWSASLVPAAFVVLNAVSYRKRLFSAMERGGGAKDLGTVYYAISLVVLAASSFAIGKPWLGGIGILSMGWGDGLAAIVGPRFPKPSLPFAPTKSLAGSLTVFLATFIVSLAGLSLGLGFPAGPALVLGASACAFAAAFLEAVTPLGFDNLSLPLGASFVAWLFTLVLS